MKFKKLVAMGLAGAMTLALSGCTIGGSSGWAIKDDKGQVPAGVYIQYMMSAFSEGAALSGDPTGNPWGKEIEGKPAEQWIDDRGMQLTKEHLAIENKFQELGLTLDEEMQQTVDAMVEYQWAAYGERYVLSGVSLESFTSVVENGFKANALFQHYYGEGGELAPSEEEYQKYYNDNYTRSLFIRYSKNDLDAMTAEEREALNKELKEGEEPRQSGLEQAEAALARAKAGEDFLGLIAEVEKANLPEGEELHSHEDPKVHDQVISKNDATLPGKYRTEVAAMADNELKIIEDGSYYYLAKRLPLEPATYADHKEEMLMEMKTDEFKGTISQWANGLSNLQVNQKMVEKYGSAGMKK